MAQSVAQQLTVSMPSPQTLDILEARRNFTGSGTNGGDGYSLSFPLISIQHNDSR